MVMLKGSGIDICRYVFQAIDIDVCMIFNASIMNRRSFALLLSVSCSALFLGVAVGFLAGRVSLDRIDGTDPVTKGAVAETTNVSEVNDTTCVSVSTTNIPTLFDILATIRVPKPLHSPSGPGMIKGTVRTEAGTPLSGVEITLSLMSDELPDDIDQERSGQRDEFDLEKRVVDAVAYHRFDVTFERKTKTDEHGEYAFENTGEASYNVYAKLANYDFDCAGSSAYDVMADSSVDFVAKQRVLQRCLVLLPDGTVPTIAEIRYRNKQGTNNYAFWDPQNTSIPLPVGLWEMYAVGMENDKFCSERLNVDVAPNKPCLTFRLNDCPGVRGRVIMPKGRTSQWVTVCAVPIRNGLLPDSEVIRQFRKKEQVHRDEYKYAVAPLDPGDYLLAVCADSTSIFILHTERISISNRLIRKDLAVKRPPERFIRVRAVGPDSEPVTDADISVQFDPFYSSVAQDMFCGKNDDGTFWIMHPDNTSDTYGNLRSITIVSPKYGTAEVEWKPRMDQETVVRFLPRASLTVSVWGIPPDLSVTQCVAVLIEPGSGGRCKEVWLGPDGKAQFADQKAREYSLTLYGGDKRRGQMLHRRELTLHAGENDEHIILPSFHPLRITVANAEDNSIGSIRSIHVGKSYSVTSSIDSKSGTFTYEYLPAGKYLFTMVRGRRELQMQVSVPEQQDVQFEGRPTDAILVRIVNRNGDLGNAGLRDGDLITGIDGVGFANMRQFSRSFLQRLEGATLNILRSGRALDLIVPPGITRADDDADELIPICKDLK